MLAKAPVKSPSPASRLLQVWREPQSRIPPRFCRSQACRRRRPPDRHRQQAGSYRFGVPPNPESSRDFVGAGLPAMASVRSPSPASRLLQVWRAPPIPNPPSIRRSRLAGDSARQTAIAGKPGSYRFGVNPQSRTHPRSVGARLAGDGVREIAIASKPGSYRFGVRCKCGQGLIFLKDINR